MSWATLQRLKSKHSLLGICEGDFNEIIRAHENIGGRLRPFKQMQDFRDVLDECGFRDSWEENLHGVMDKGMGTPFGRG